MYKNNQKISIFLLVAPMVSIFSFNHAFAAAPSVTTNSADITSSHNVTLNCSYNSNGLNTTLWFQLGTNSSLSGARNVYANPDCTAGVINLLSGTTYYFKAVARNADGTTQGSINSFTMPGSSGGSASSTGSSNTGTGVSSNGNSSNYSGSSNVSGPTAPLAATNGPASVSSNSAVLNGSINPNNADTKFWFEFGLTNSFGKKTSVELAGSGNSWQLVTGNLSGLESGRTYYYRVVAQNNFGTALGDTRNFTTTTSQTGGINQSSGGGQVLGSTSSGAGSNNSGESIQNSNPVNSRPSFISLEYSLADNGALVLVADDVKPGPGDEFTYTVVYKNDNAFTFSEAKLKVIIPSEAYYVSSNIEPAKTSANIVEFNLDDVRSGDQGAVVVVSRIREDVASETNVIFTSVMTYKDRLGVQLATTAYLTVRTGQTDASLSASLFGNLFGSSSILVMIALGLVVLMGVLTYGLVKIRKRNGNKKDEFELDSFPATFEPIGFVQK